MNYIRFLFVLYWFAPFLKFGTLPSENPRCASGLEDILRQKNEDVFKTFRRHFQHVFNPSLLRRVIAGYCHRLS